MHRCNLYNIGPDVSLCLANDWFYLRKVVGKWAGLVGIMVMGSTSCRGNLFGEEVAAFILKSFQD